MSTFEYPLIGPSDIRSIYLSALQEHVYTDKCPFCMGVHLMEGENYILKLERALTEARNKVGPSFKYRHCPVLICSQTTLEVS